MNLAQVKQQFVTRFNKVTDDGEATEIVAIKLQWNIPQRSVTLSQEHRTREILDDYNMSTSNPISTPMETLTISNKDCPEVGSDEWHLMQQIPYRECVGRLTNLSRTTRPDISYAVLQSNRYLHNPGLKHWQFVKRILRYLAKDPTKALTLSPLGHNSASLYSSMSKTEIQGLLK
jgi:hypothetical protein